ncbi:MAG: glutathione synthase [Myxococcales bacterium]|nr:glutathione synthase [Myxococcales bacterium]
MRILVIMDPIERVLVDKDTTFGFLLAAQARGHDVWYCLQDQLYAVGDRAYASCAPIEVRPTQGQHFSLDAPVDHPLSFFDSVWMRKDPPVDRAYLHATHLLDLAGPTTLVVNRPSGLRYANEKLYALHFPDFTPETMVTRDAARVKRWLAERDAPLIVKPVDGHGGYGVFLLEPGDRNIGSILESLTEEGRRWIMAQAYLPAAREGDKRIILVDGQPLGAILRVPQADDHRGNIHVGGTVVQAELTDREQAICAALAPRLQRDGLYFVGLDVIGGYLTEVNVTSPTGIREVKALGGADIGDRYVAWCEREVARLGRT